MLYTKDDFKSLRFNPLCEEKILEKYPDLYEIISQEMARDTNIDCLLRFVIMLNDPQSIVFLSEKNVERRKDMAAELAGLPDNLQFRDEVFTYMNKTAFGLTVNYLKRFAKSKEFAALVTMEQIYWEEIRLLNMPIIADSPDKDALAALEKKSKIKAELDQDLNRIDAYYKKFVGEDENLIKKRERMTPENVRQLKSK